MAGIGRNILVARSGSDRTLLLRRSADINRAKRVGRRVPTMYFNMMVAPSGTVATQIAVIVGRKFGHAVQRNRAKRRVRELARWVESRLQPGAHILIFPKRPLVTLAFASLQAFWEGLFRREGLLRE